MVDGLANIGHFNAMLVRLVLTFHRVALLAALTVALVGTGFAHRIAAPQDEAALAFALVNGVSLADICGDDPTGGTHTGADCQACQIVGAADLPSLTGAEVELELAFHAAVVAPLESRAIARLPDLAHRPQGPPVA